MDVSPAGELFVIGGGDGELKVGTLDTGEFMVSIESNESLLSLSTPARDL